MLRLYTFTISHFSEKVRWALDYEHIDYTEHRVPPGVHVPVIRWHAPKQSVPMLIHYGGSEKKVVQGSGAILDYMHNTLCAPRLALPDDARASESAKLEAEVDHAFGLGVQRIVYETLLRYRPALIDLWAQGAPWWSRAFYAIAYPFMTRALRRMYKINPDAVARAKDTFRRTFEDLDRILEKRRYLLSDDEPSRADITVASLLAPLCTPAEHIVRWPDLQDEGQNEIIREFKGRPTWDFALRMYRDHRKPVAST